MSNWEKIAHSSARPKFMEGEKCPSNMQLQKPSTSNDFAKFTLAMRVKGVNAILELLLWNTWKLAQIYKTNIHWMSLSRSQAKKVTNVCFLRGVAYMNPNLLSAEKSSQVASPEHFAVSIDPKWWRQAPQILNEEAQTRDEAPSKL